MSSRPRWGGRGRKEHYNERGQLMLIVCVRLLEKYLGLNRTAGAIATTGNYPPVHASVYYRPVEENNRAEDTRSTTTFLQELTNIAAQTVVSYEWSYLEAFPLPDGVVSRTLKPSHSRTVVSRS